MKLSFIPVESIGVHSGRGTLRRLSEARAPVRERLVLFQDDEEPGSYLLFYRPAFRILLEQLEAADTVNDDELLERALELARFKLPSKPVIFTPSEPAVATVGKAVRGVWLPDALVSQVKTGRRAPPRLGAAPPSGASSVPPAGPREPRGAGKSRRRARPRRDGHQWEIRRTPHLRPPRSVRPNSNFRVRVWCDDEPADPDEEVEEINKTLPEGIERLPLDVWLTGSKHFEVQTPAIQRLVIARDEPTSSPVVFEVRAHEQAASVEGDPRLTAVFYHEALPMGSVSRRVRIEKRRPMRRVRGESSEGLELSPIEAADLTVTVVGERQSFHMTVESPILRDFHTKQEGSFDLREDAAAFVARTLRTVAAENEEVTDPEERLAELRGAGTIFWECAPDVFHEAIWQLAEDPIREDGEPRRIYIVTQEPALPWELMVPERQLGDERDDPPAIGVMFAVGRWIHPRVKPPLRETVEIERGYIIAPTYKNQDPIDAEAETTFIKDKFKGVSIKPVSFTNLNHELGRGPVSLLHFIAHGQADADEDRILLDRDHPLTSQRLLGMTGVRTGCRSGRPLVFLNACEVGRPIGGLTGAGGFARAFATLGMTAMIAPLWSVDTEIASQVAIEIYEEALKAPRRSLAEIVREIRSRALEPGVDGWQDSRAAYCLYGHPSARLA